MAGKTKTIGTTQAVAGLNSARALDFKDKYPGMHVCIVSKKQTMHGGHTTQYGYFKSLGLDELEQLPHPDLVLMGEPMAQYLKRKQEAIDLHRANMGYTGAKKETEGPDIATVTVRTQFGGEE